MGDSSMSYIQSEIISDAIIIASLVIQVLYIQGDFYEVFSI